VRWNEREIALLYDRITTAFRLKGQEFWKGKDHPLARFFLLLLA
jgi:hypothetical protein